MHKAIVCASIQVIRRWKSHLLWNFYEECVLTFNVVLSVDSVYLFIYFSDHRKDKQRDNEAATERLRIKVS